MRAGPGLRGADGFAGADPGEHRSSSAAPAAWSDTASAVRMADEPETGSGRAAGWTGNTQDCVIKTRECRHNGVSAGATRRKSQWRGRGIVRGLISESGVRCRILFFFLAESGQTRYFPKIQNHAIFPAGKDFELRPDPQEPGHFCDNRTFYYSDTTYFRE